MGKAQQRLAIYQTEEGIEIYSQNQPLQGATLICTCQHPQAAVRIAKAAAKIRNLPLLKRD